jgi:8-oxo-dGTP diphosphatase
VNDVSDLATSSPAQRKRVVVVAAFAVRGERILLTRRPEGKHLAGTWEFPGGKLEAGETPEDALVRELKEELAVASTAGPILDAVTFAYPHFDLLMLLYGAELHGVPQPVQVAEIGWFSAAEARRLSVPPADLPILDRLEIYLARFPGRSA